MRAGLVVETRSGRVCGADAGGLRVWRGIPYAQPPVGALRHRPPEPVEAWSGVRAADAVPPRAMQADVASPLLGGLAGQPECAEDCLYLNVAVSDEPPPPGGYPVLLWIHGGGYLRGSGAGDPVGDGVALARRGLAVVTFNYRLGAFGFLSLADVLGPGEADAGNAGLLDQVAALRWVRNNIAAFGGNPRSVTVYGVSAGAKSVANLLASPRAAGLITRAISSSGGGEHVMAPKQALALRRRLFAALGLADSAAGRLRDVPARDLLDAQESIASGPTATWIWRPSLGPALPRWPIDAIAGGAARGVALLAGNNANEGATYQALEPSAAGQAPRVLRELFGPATAAAILRRYAAARPDLDEAGVHLAVLGDERYGIPTHRLALAHAGHTPVWRYRLDAAPPGVPAGLAGGHGLDAVLVWGSDHLAPPDDPRARLGRAMADAWAGFARTGDPASASLGPWPVYTVERRATLVLDTDPHVETAPDAAVTALWKGRTWASGTWWSIDGVS